MEIIKKTNQKVNHLILGLASTGIFLVILAVLIIITQFLLRWLVGVVVLAIAFSFFYAAYKVWSLKKEAKGFLEKWGVK